MSDTSTIIEFQELDAFRQLCGPNDKNLRLIEELLGVRIDARGTTVTITGADHDVGLACDALRQFTDLIERGYKVYASDIPRGVKILSGGKDVRLSDVFLDTIFVASGKRKISPKNLSQKLYIDAMRTHDLVFGIGAAGTGKTYLAMAMAVKALVAQEVKRIILTRPAVEAGEKLGFLPGDMAEKVNPYLRPLYDALYDMLDVTRVQRFMADNVIEVAPLAFMRGRTLNDAFVILDEAQNATREQMKMFLTRLGYNTQTVVTGDVTQTDLPDRGRSGLGHAAGMLEGEDGIAICQFTADDVVRHPLVMRIINAYAKDDERRDAERETKKRERAEARSQRSDEV
ncbi:MAG: phosphate starvation-inducible PhoH-like protein [Myxococcota bacterium]